MILFLILVGQFGPPLLQIDHSMELPAGRSLAFPVDATDDGTTLFVADGADDFIVGIRRSGEMFAFSGHGSGPGEIGTSIDSLNVEGSFVVIREFNKTKRHLFDLNGKFVRTEQGRANSAKERYVACSQTVARTSGFLFQHATTGKPIGKLDGKGFLGWHLSQAILSDLDERLVVVKKRGVVEIWDENGQIHKKFSLHLERYKMPIQPNKIANKLMEKLGEKAESYLYGVPILSATAHGDLLWVVVLDESTASQIVGKPQSTFLYQVNIFTESMNLIPEVSVPSAVKVCGDFLIVLSQDDGYVKLFAL